MLLQQGIGDSINDTIETIQRSLDPEALDKLAADIKLEDLGIDEETEEYGSAGPVAASTEVFEAVTGVMMLAGEVPVWVGPGGTEAPGGEENGDQLTVQVRWAYVVLYCRRMTWTPACCRCFDSWP